MAREWPPVDLIADLSLNPNAHIESVLDENVLAELPKGTEVLSIDSSGASAWVQTVRIETRQKDGTIKPYFKKAQSGDVGKRMMLGTYESEKAFFEYAPDHIPKPLAWGSYESDPETYFYLAEFREMVDELPNAQAFVSIIANIHRDSRGKAPDGRFGFHVPTHLANIPNDNSWKDSWEAWYTVALQRMFDLEALSHSKNEEFEELKKEFFDKVVPRLLRPLESGGRKVEPCLIHSDLWPGNFMPDADTDKIIIFDSCAYWGHNESDLGSWRAPRYRMGRPFLRQYQKQMGMSVPQEDWDDRNALYALRYDLLVSALFPNSEKFRNLVLDEMRRLCQKYPNGFADFHEIEDKGVKVSN
ncbi:MAG: hypothetical protein M4579_001747 [Chaenotheca gracillima]|nr:MAG: hypothetical protein M4579_001747 [Chaenotheca gracillima]